MTTQILIDLNLIQLIALTFLSAWSLLWTIFATWKAAKKNSKKWFVVLLVLNTAGILEILYIFIFSREKSNNKAEDLKNLSDSN